MKHNSKIRKTDEAVTQIFKDVTVISDRGDSHIVPIFWATPEKTDMMWAEKIKLPALHVCQNEYHYDWMDGSMGLSYHVNAYSMYQEDMNQVIEQIMRKFDNKGNCRLLDISKGNKEKDTESKLKVCHTVFTVKVDDINKRVQTCTT